MNYEFNKNHQKKVKSAWVNFHDSYFMMHNSSQSGQVVITAVIFFLLITTSVGMGVINPVLRQVKQANDFSHTRSSLFVSQAVNEDALYRLKTGKQFVSPSTLTLDGFSATATTTSVSGGIQIDSSGNAFNLIRKVQTHVSSGAGASFNYGVQIGAGGFVGSNGTVINGNLFSNGSISGATLIKGEVISAGPYGSVGQIHATSSVYARTISGATIDGNAYYQSISGSTVGGTSYPGSVDQATSSMPIPDSVIASLEADAVAGGTTNCGGATYNLSGTAGPRKYACSVNISGDLVLTGTLWINGNLTTSNNVNVSVSGTQAGKTLAIIVDNQYDRMNSSKIIQSNNVTFTGSGAGSYVMLISMNNAEEVSSLNNINAIDINNNISGAVLVYAPHGQITVGNNTSLKEITGYKLFLLNNAVVTYETGLANLLFSSGPSGGYVFDKWREVE